MPLRTQGVCSLHIGFIRLIVINICEAVCEENTSESATFSSVFCTEMELNLHKVISELIHRIYIAVYAFQT